MQGTIVRRVRTPRRRPRLSVVVTNLRRGLRSWRASEPFASLNRGHAASACPVGVADDASSKFGTHRGQDAFYIFHSPDTTCRSVHSPPGFRNTFHQEEDRASHATRRSAVTAQQRANEPPPAATIVRRRGHQPDPVVHRLFIRVVTKPKPGVALVGQVSLDKLLAAVRPLPGLP